MYNNNGPSCHLIQICRILTPVGQWLMKRGFFLQVITWENPSTHWQILVTQQSGRGHMSCLNSPPSCQLQITEVTFTDGQIKQLGIKATQETSHAWRTLPIWLGFIQPIFAKWEKSCGGKQSRVQVRFAQGFVSSWGFTAWVHSAVYLVGEHSMHGSDLQSQL